MQRALRIACLLLLAGPLVLHVPCATGAEPQSGAMAQFEPEEIEPRELAQRLAAEPGRFVLIDVRMRPEFVTSHLVGSSRLDPNTPGKALVRRLGGDLRGKTIVFYCTGFDRSAHLALAVMDDVLLAGADRVMVLKGGIIAWANEGLPLVNRRGATLVVHTHDAMKAKLLRSPAVARF